MSSGIRIQVLETRRLILRPSSMDDAERLTELLQDPEIARWTASIPYPFTIEHAREFLSIRANDDASGSSFVWAITDRDDGALMGAMGLHDVERDRGRAELGYWLGADYRGNGFAAEAARRVISWAFEVGGFHRIQATHLPGNQASAGVMRSIGMREEGILRGYGFKNGEYHDLHLHAILQVDPSWIATQDQLD